MFRINLMKNVQDFFTVNYKHVGRNKRSIIKMGDKNLLFLTQKASYRIFI